MFEELRLLQSTPQGIVLQTHKGNNIENEIGAPADLRCVNKYNALFNKHRSTWDSPGGWVERKPPCGIYNCVGHAWASRRTSVFAPDMEGKVCLIFEDDGYRVVDWPAEPVAVGDLVTYWESARKRTCFYHVGVVTELRQALVGGTAQVPWVLSKWDSTSGEVLHHFMNHPFPGETETQFWTDRPPAKA